MFKVKVYLLLGFCCYPFAGSFGQPIAGDLFRFTNIGDTSDIKEELRQAIELLGEFPDSARELSMAAYRQSTVITYHFGMGQALNILGLVDQNAGNHKAAILNFEKALLLLKQSGRELRLSVPIINIGNAWFYQGDYLNALKSYYRALNTLEEFDNPVVAPDSIQAYLNIALIWSKAGSIPQAKAALKIAENIPGLYKDTFLLSQFYSSAAQVYTVDNMHLAVDYLQKAIAVTGAARLYDELIASLNTCASLYNHLNKPDSALIYLEKTKTVLDSHFPASPYNGYHYSNQLGHALLLKKQYQAAENVLKPLYEELKNEDYSDILMPLEKNLTLLYEATGSADLALKHSRNYLDMMSDLHNEKNAKLTELWVKLMQEQNQKTLLTKELRIEQQQRTIRARNIWIIGIGTGVLLLGSMLVLLIRNHRHKQKVQQSKLRQLQQQQEIEQLKAQVAGEEKERNRIAVELHDNVGSLLTTAIYSLKTMHEVPEPKTYPQKMEAILKQIQQEIRNTSHILMPDVLLRQSFSDSALEYCAFLERDTGLHIDVQLQGTFEPISKDIKLLFFRILQELLQNIVKHAHAEKVLIQLHASMELISLTVEDNGIGFDPGSDQARGKGFKNIENRLKILNGHISYNTAIGKGTSIYVEASLNVNEQLE